VGKETDIGQYAQYAVISLLRNEEGKFLNNLQLSVFKASAVCMKDRQKDVLQVVLSVVIHETILVHTKRHVTLNTFEHHRSCHSPR
jgi:hypothetical protein